MRGAPATLVRFRVYALLCSFTLLISALLVHPVLEQGVNDDFSYTYIAGMLARTGHIVYDGWVTPMLGWQLYWAALFIHLFGFSFTTVRLSMLPIAMLTAFLLQRSFVRSGLSENYATYGTLTVVLSSLFLGLAFSFMSDMPGLFVIVLCFYGCLRVLDAQTPRAQMAWLAFTVTATALGGTARQIAWLGLIVMIPSLLWLLRRERTLVRAGIVGWVAGCCFIAGAMFWFNHQPHSQHESLLPQEWTLAAFKNFCSSSQAALQEFVVLLLPATAGFLSSALLKRHRRALILCGLVTSILLGFLLFSLSRHHHGEAIMAPTLRPPGGFQSAIEGIQPVVLPGPLRLFLTAVSFCAAAATFALSLEHTGPAETSSSPTAGRKPAQGARLAVLVVPFCTVYILLLIPRASVLMIFDRYLLPLLVFATLGLLRFTQATLGPRIPFADAVAALFFCGYGIAATHDGFALYRARLEQIGRVVSSGVAPNEINGGFEYNGWQEIRHSGFVYDDRLPGNKPAPVPLASDVCAPQLGYFAPHLDRHFALAWSPSVCDGPANFPPVEFHTWLPPQTGYIYVVRDHGNADGN